MWQNRATICWTLYSSKIPYSLQQNYKINVKDPTNNIMNVFSKNGLCVSNTFLQDEILQTMERETNNERNKCKIKMFWIFFNFNQYQVPSTLYNVHVSSQFCQNYHPFYFELPWPTATFTNFSSPFPLRSVWLLLHKKGYTTTYYIKLIIREHKRHLSLK